MMISSISRAGTRLKSKSVGFTLIELLIAIAILGILAAIVIPSYNAQVRRNGRSDAIAAMLQIAQDLERCRSDTMAYNDATCTAPYVNPVNSERGFYQVAVATTATTFTLTATPIAGTTQANDTDCAQFTLTQAGVRAAQDNTAADATANCWR